MVTLRWRSCYACYAPSYTPPAWVGSYRVGSCSAAEIATADAGKLAQCTSWNQCSTGATLYNKFEEISNAGPSCPINLKCTVFSATQDTGLMIEQPCDLLPPPSKGLGTEDKRRDGKRRNKNNLEVMHSDLDPLLRPECLCEHSAPAPEFIAALEELRTSSPGASEKCNPFVVSSSKVACNSSMILPFPKMEALLPFFRGYEFFILLIDAFCECHRYLFTSSTNGAG